MPTLPPMNKLIFSFPYLRGVHTLCWQQPNTSRLHLSIACKLDPQPPTSSLQCRPWKLPQKVPSSPAKYTPQYLRPWPLSITLSYRSQTEGQMSYLFLNASLFYSSTFRVVRTEPMIQMSEWWKPVSLRPWEGWWWRQLKENGQNLKTFGCMHFWVRKNTLVNFFDRKQTDMGGKLQR